MLIQTLEQKTRLALTTVVVTIVGCVVICLLTVFGCFSMIQKERDQIYVIDGDIPFLAERAQLETTFIMEAKAHIMNFHHYFFSLPPDNEYIQWTINKAMYLADGSALKQKQALDENGFYSDIVSASAVCSIMCDSINFNEHTKQFKFYGKQLIKRRTKSQKRLLVTAGSLQTVPRSQNNPHGLLITNWKTLENRDITY